MEVVSVNQWKSVETVYQMETTARRLNPWITELVEQDESNSYAKKERKEREREQRVHSDRNSIEREKLLRSKNDFLFILKQWARSD